MGRRIMKFGIRLLYFTLFQFLLFSELDAFRRAISRGGVVELSGLLNTVTTIELIISVIIIGIGLFQTVKVQGFDFKFWNKNND